MREISAQHCAEPKQWLWWRTKRINPNNFCPFSCPCLHDYCKQSDASNFCLVFNKQKKKKKRAEFTEQSSNERR